jgi:hypothetical protein
MNMPDRITVNVRCRNPKCREIVCLYEHTPPDHFSFLSADGRIRLPTKVTVHCGYCGCPLFLKIGKKSLVYFMSQ